MTSLELLNLRFQPRDLGQPDLAALTVLLQGQLTQAAAVAGVKPEQVYPLALAGTLQVAIVQLLRGPDSRRLGDVQTAREIGPRLFALRQELRAACTQAGIPCPGDPNLQSVSQEVQSVFSTDPYGSAWRPQW